MAVAAVLAECRRVSDTESMAPDMRVPVPDTGSRIHGRGKTRSR